MKSREKIYNNFFVKPLYKKVTLNRTKDTINTFKSTVSSDNEDGVVTIEIDKSVKLVGDELNVKNIVKSGNFNKHNNNTKHLPGTCILSDHNENNSEIVFKKYIVDSNVVKKSDLSKMLSIDKEKQNDKDKSKDEGNVVIIHETPDTWLRVYPARAFRKEPICSIVFRCVCCQLGLFSFLSIWTLIFVMLIHSIEGPYEMKVGEEFELAQNDLIVELATDLRQTNQFSDKWYETVERLIRKERTLAIEAVKKGARIHAGTFWDVAGTFLFCVYVMTALGFGAPVPQTGNGRTCSLLYAAVSVPMHIFLMVNLSSCVVHQVEQCFKRTKSYLKRKHSGKDELVTGAVENTAPVTKTRKVVTRIVRVISLGRCVPLAAIIYYILGVLFFGVARKKPTASCVMFPMEFTTTGGLEHVDEMIRFIYGIYIEGAMTLLSCGLATLRRHSGSAVTDMTSRFRLFKSESCRKCKPDANPI